ncbi:MAG: serine/threonine-protein kinase, partial [Planctomycetota bacterium]
MSDLQTDILADLVARCLEEMSERDGEISIEEICAEHPELIDEVRMSVELAGELPRIQAVGLAKDDFIGEVMAGRYRVDSSIGAGAMGVVYSGTDLELGRRVAIKVVHARFLDREQALARFDREAAALAAISHDSVVTIFDRGVTDVGAPFLVMERIEGVSCSEILTLAERHKSGDATEWLSAECGIENVRESSLVRQMIRWVAGLASGLEAAHAAGVYHRDVKPSNIMIRLDGRPVLLDFGIAAIENEGTLTRTEAAVGTPAYMAPEVLFGGKGRKRSRATQDVYGLAATLYHLLTLKAPYKGSPTEILAALATRDPLPAFKVRPGLPRDVQAILDHGLARSPGSRYATPAAMEKDLRALLAFQPVSVRPTTTLTRTLRRLGRSKLFVGAAAATLVGAGILGGLELRRAAIATARAVYDEAYCQLPPNLGIVLARNRVFPDSGPREAVAEVLDRMVESGGDPISSLNLRAAFRLDHRDLRGARRDLVELVKVAG